MAMNRTLTPAYGRDYTSKAAVVADFNEGKDFTLQPAEQLFNRSSAEDDDIVEVNIRYSKLTRVAVLVFVPATKQWEAK